jgi:hypothetical protein
MPTIFTAGPYRFYFTSHDRGEPAHVHVERDGLVAKFWLEPISLADGGGMKNRDLKNIEDILSSRSAECLEAWHAFFK